MSTHQTTVPAAEGKANAGAVQDSSDVVAMGAPTSEGTPRWSATDHNTASLLDLLAEQHPATPTEADEWKHFKAVLAEVALATGLIDQNAVRPLLRGEIKPQRIGAFYHRAAKAGLIAWTGQWHESDDLDGKNSGKPTRVYRWLGAAS